MVRERRNMFGDYSADNNENMTPSNSGARFLVIKDEYRPMLWDGMKGNGEALIDVIPYQMEEPCGVSVDIEPKTKPKEKKFDNNGCHINKKKGDWVFQLNYWTHSNVGPNKATVVCPRTFGESCPVCEKEQQLLSNWPYESGSDDSKAYYRDVVAPLKTKNRTLFNIHVDGDDGGKQYLWDTSWFFVPKELLGINRDPRTKEPIYWFDPDTGKSIFFNFSNFDKNETRPDVSGVQFIARDKPIPDEWIDAAIPLDQVLIKTSYEEIKAMMDGVVEHDAPDSCASPSAEEEVQEQLDAAFGRSDAVEDEKTEEASTAPRRSRQKPAEDNPLVVKVMHMETMEDVDAFCEEKGIEVYMQDYEELGLFKAAVAEWLKEDRPF
jgi:hypothetical protein